MLIIYTCLIYVSKGRTAAQMDSIIINANHNNITIQQWRKKGEAELTTTRRIGRTVLTM
jgi:hypothetical protein